MQQVDGGRFKGAKYELSNASQQVDCDNSWTQFDNAMYEDHLHYFAIILYFAPCVSTNSSFPCLIVHPQNCYLPITQVNLSFNRW
jgi:hypothetical protein